MTEPAPRWRARAPIGLQLVALLLASLLAAQLITFAMIAVMPPPRPQIYRAFEIAAALKGGAVTPRLGRPLVRTLEPQLSTALARPDATAGGRSALALASELGVPAAEVRLLTHERRPPWERPRGMRGPRPPGAPPSQWSVQGGREPFDRGARFGGGRWPAADIPIFGDVEAAVRRPSGDWVVVRSQPEAFPTEWERRILIWLAAGFLLVAPAGFLFARRITAPLKKFSEAADRLGRDPTAPPLTLSGPAEIGLAARAFNEMQARLRRYIEDRTAMVGAISHDLRTPLARIRFKMERAPAPLRDSVLADVAQMEQMIGDVLAFIRDEGQPRQRERLDLLSLVECVADDAAMLGGDVEIDEAQALTVEGDPVGLQRLFANLVDNAVKYGAGARIAVRQDGCNAIVSIADFGPGLTAPEIEKVFLPFYRTDASRNLDKGGVGLGLPIARATARAHGGDVELSSDGDGAIARVSLPLAI
ncbi:MAG: hypothetical protein JWP73_701 [Phenylobacterium sp.]|nr:hypothetical protein [Phenylobacterium sp.]